MATYKVKYQQSVEEGGAPVIQTYKLSTTDTIWAQQQLNTIWNSSGCYGGAMAQNGSLMGCSSTANWTGWKSNEVYSDMRDVSINFGVPASQQNLRFMVKYNNGAGSVERQSFNWTGFQDETVQAIQEGYNNLTSTSSVSIYDPYKKDIKNVSINGTSNSPLNVAPLDELKINELVWVPYFIIKETELWGFDDQLNSYSNIQSYNVGIYTWDQLKPADKTEQGALYDDDLFTKGWTDVSATQEDGIRYRYCCGAVLVPYYGKSSRTYDPVNDTYVEGANPDDNKVYGSRSILGGQLNDAGDYPQILDATALSSARIMVMTEVYDNTTESVFYTTPAGISFANTTPNQNYLTPTSYVLQQDSYSLTSDFRRFSATTNWTTFWFNNNLSYSNFYKDQDFTTADQEAPDLVVPATAIKINVSISDIYDSLPSGTRYFLDGIGPNIYGYTKSNRTTRTGAVAYFPIGDLWATIASLGCYVADNTTCAQNAPTGAYTGENNHLYLGYMSQGGITNGTMLQGGDIIQSVQAGIDDIIQNTPYTPVNPGGGGGEGGDDPTDPSVPKDDYGSIPYNSVLPVVGAATSFLTSYILNTAQVNTIGYNLWSKINDPNDETGGMNMLKNFFKTNYNSETIDYELTLAEIPDYFVALRWFPFSLANNVNNVSTGESAIRVGTGLTPINASAPTKVITNSMCYLSGGTVSVPWTYESYLDYEPYTSASIYIPYCGTYEVQPSLIMGRTLSLHYSVSLLTGAICAIIMVQSSNGVSYPLAVLNGMVGFDIAITGNTQNAQIRNAVAAKDEHTSKMLDKLVSGAQATALSSSNFLNSMGQMSGKGGISGLGDLRTYLTGWKGNTKQLVEEQLFSGAGSILNTALSGINAGAAGIGAIASLVAEQSAYNHQLPFTYGTQPLIVGSSSSMANLILPQTAFVQIRRKNRHDLGADIYGNTFGYESKNSKRLGDLNGFTKCVNPKLSIAGATESELNLIFGYLQTGVYL